MVIWESQTTSKVFCNILHPNHAATHIQSIKSNFAPLLLRQEQNYFGFISFVGLISFKKLSTIHPLIDSEKAMLNTIQHIVQVAFHIDKRFWVISMRVAW